MNDDGVDIGGGWKRLPDGRIVGALNGDQYIPPLGVHTGQVASFGNDGTPRDAIGFELTSFDANYIGANSVVSEGGRLNSLDNRIIDSAISAAGNAAHTQTGAATSTPSEQKSRSPLMPKGLRWAEASRIAFGVTCFTLLGLCLFLGSAAIGDLSRGYPLSDALMWAIGGAILLSLLTLAISFGFSFALLTSDSSGRLGVIGFAGIFAVIAIYIGNQNMVSETAFRGAYGTGSPLAGFAFTLFQGVVVPCLSIYGAWQANRRWVARQALIESRGNCPRKRDELSQHSETIDS